MGQDHRIIDELKHFERLCLDLAEDSALPLERAALLELAANYRTEAWTQSRTQSAQYRKEPDRLGGFAGGLKALIFQRKITGWHRLRQRRPYFKTGALNHSATLPAQSIQPLSG